MINEKIQEGVTEFEIEACGNSMILEVQVGQKTVNL